MTAHTTVHIGHGIDQHSEVEILAGGDVTIGEKINESSRATITSTFGKIDLEQTVDNKSSATLKAGTTVHIGKKLDQHSTNVVIAQGDITIGEKLDANSNSTITSVNGSITVVQGMSANASATLRAPNGTITMETIDDGCTLNWTARSLNYPHQNGTINHLP